MRIMLGAARLSFTGACLALAGCVTSDPWQEPAYPLETQARHPIVLEERAQGIEIFPRSARGLDERQAADVRAFASAYRRDEAAQLTLIVPVHGGKASPAVRQTAREIHTVLVAQGIRRFEAVPEEAQADQGAVQPLRLRYTTLGATVAHACGQWPYDLAAGSLLEGAQNEPYWNLGCATQANLAAQVADPLDLVRPRAETPVLASVRLQAVDRALSGKGSGDGGSAAASASGAAASSAGN